MISPMASAEWPKPFSLACAFSMFRARAKPPFAASAVMPPPMVVMAPSPTLPILPKPVTALLVTPVSMSDSLVPPVLAPAVRPSPSWDPSLDPAPVASIPLSSLLKVELRSLKRGTMSTHAVASDAIGASLRLCACRYARLVQVVAQGPLVHADQIVPANHVTAVGITV